MTNKHYILNQNHEVIETDLLTWAKFIEKENRIIKQETLPNKKWISTVFLGLDHNFSQDGPPLLFETMVFPEKGNFEDLDCKRYSTWEEAEKGHEELKEKHI
jgi:hypothetical protein